MAVEIARRRFTIEEFEQMIRAGVFEEDERIELIEGEIVEMSPIELRHMVCVSRLDFLLQRQLGSEFHVWVQNAIRMPNNSRPQPDVFLLKWRDDFYAGKHPTAEDVVLLIEVAESSLRYDRKIKAPRYAKAGIPEVWIVNLPKDIVEVYTTPGESGYENVRRAGRGESLPLLGSLDGTISVDDIFG
jgi:Uma2 family endonuclease